MKGFRFIILFVLLCSCSNKVKTISLIEYQDIQYLSSNEDLHKDKDVEMFISEPDKDRHIYTCIIYRFNQGELRAYQAYLSSLNTFDRAIYKWINDSTVTFNLSNTHKKSTKYTVMGYGGSTYLDWK